MALLWNPDGPWGATDLKQFQDAIRSLGVQFHPIEVRGPDDLDGALAAVSNGSADGLLALPDPVISVHDYKIAGLAVQGGGLLAYGPDLPDLFRRSATYVDKILKGARPADLPVEQPTKFDLVVNLRTAQTLGLSIPQSVLLQATEIIQ